MHTAPSLLAQGALRRLGVGIVHHTICTNDDRILVIARGGATLRRTLDGAVLWEVDCPASCGVLQLPQGRVLLYDPVSGRLESWDLATGHQLGPLDGVWPGCKALTARPDGELLALVTADGHVLLLSGQDGLERERMAPLAGMLRSLAFSPDGLLLAVASLVVGPPRSSGSVTVWDLAERRVVHQLQIDSRMPFVGRDLQFSPDGRFVAGLLRRLSTPIASRWAHIVLRRALLTQAAAPPGINPGDWIAERARTLLNMGEIDGAKALIDNLPIDHITPRLVRVAGQVHLAAADLGGLCPIADTGGAVSPDPLWKLAEAMCAAMAGDDITAASGFDGLRDGDQVDPFDIMLGERIATISGGGGRAANVEWDAVDHVTPYRFGVATAAGVAVPLPLLTKLGEATGGTSWGWVLHAPGQAADVRAAALRPAVAIGIASVDDMVGAISAASADLDRTALDASPAGTLRAAYAAATTADRVAAMRTIWASGGTEPDRYAAHIETALAAARLPVDAAVAADAPGLIAAMLGAGIEDHAAKWWPVVRGGDDAASRSAWALLAVGANGGIAVSPARFAAYAKDVPPHRAALLLAALDGLGHARGDGWQASRDSVGLVPVTNSWSEAIDAAAVSRRTGEVAVLAATGLQTRWTVVSPGYFAHIIAAYVAVGRVHEARMLAAEAVTRG